MSEFTKVSVGQLKVGQAFRLANASKQRSQEWALVTGELRKSSTSRSYLVAQSTLVRTEEWLNSNGMHLVYERSGAADLAYGYPTRVEVRNAFRCDQCGRYFLDQIDTYSDLCGFCAWGTPDGAPRDSDDYEIEAAPAPKRERVSGATILAMGKLADAGRGLTRQELHADPMVIKGAVNRGWVTVDRAGSDRSTDLIELTAAGQTRWV